MNLRWLNVQFVMRHSAITLTVDTYGHRLEGAEAAAVNQAGTLTAIPQTLAATGTDGKLANYLLTTAMRGGCVDDATPCEIPHATDGVQTRKNPGKTRVKRESVRLDAASCRSTPARNRTIIEKQQKTTVFGTRW